VPHEEQTSSVATASADAAAGSLKQLRENDDGETTDFILDARPNLSRVVSVTEIETLSETPGDFNFEAALKCLSGIASRLKLSLECKYVEP
jgi:hypothetical protein